MRNKDQTKINIEKEGFFKWIVIWSLFCIGEPDLLDAIIHYLMK